MRTTCNLLLLAAFGVALGSVSARGSVPSVPAGAPVSMPASVSVPAIIEIPQKKEGFRWKAALRQSLWFLSTEHGFRLLQKKTRREFAGLFFGDYITSVKGLGGWGDGDSTFTNYVAHPMQGAAAGYIYIQNDPRGRQQEFGRSKEYWHSRLKAAGWAAMYSTQFELGPISEASIGNVGKKKGTMTFVDLVVTPVGGLGMMVAEDALQRFLLRRLESKTSSAKKQAVFRVLLNPTHSFAGLLRGRLPWQGQREVRQDAQRLPPGFPSFDFSAPGKGQEGWHESLGPGTRCGAGSYAREAGNSTPSFPSLGTCSPEDPGLTPMPFSLLIGPWSDEPAPG